jgi:phage tail-like protein
VTATQPRAYRFASAAQWARCLPHRFDIGTDGSVTPAARLGLHATAFDARGPVSTAAIDPFGAPTWRFGERDNLRLLRRDDLDAIVGPLEIDQVLAQSPRWITDRRSLWAFGKDGTTVRRYERDTLDQDLAMDLQELCDLLGDDGLPGAGTPPPPLVLVLDIASGGREGIWILARAADRTHWLVQVDCEGRPRRRMPVPREACTPHELGSVTRGTQLVLLSTAAQRLTLLDAATGAIVRSLALDDLAPCWSASRLSTDTRKRIALLGTARIAPASPAVFILDEAGDAIDGPLERLFDRATRQPAAPEAGPRAGGRPYAPDRTSTDGAAVVINDIAVARDRLWLATTAGLWQLDASEASGALASESTLLTPALYSPESDTDRGWLRAELTIGLPAGAAIHAEFASTNDDVLARQLIAFGDDRTITAARAQQRIWAGLEHPAARQFTIAGPLPAGQPIAIPLFDSQDRWLWLRLRIVTPPGTAPAPMAGLRVLYPDLSLTRYLPAVFKGDKDPNGVLRRLVGVLESTTQQIDARILGIASHIDPGTAPVEWLDYIARWLDLPWDDGLQLDAKRRIVRHAGDLLDLRGTRQGLERLVAALLGDQGTARVADVTVDHPPVRLGGGGRSGATLPMLIAGTSLTAATLDGKAVLGRARLRCAPGDDDPLREIVPTIRITATVDPGTQRALQTLFARVLAQYIPAGIRLRVRWHAVEPFAGAADAQDDGVVLDGNGPGVLGKDSQLGRTVLAGRRTDRLDDAGLGMGVRLT